MAKRKKAVKSAGRKARELIEVFFATNRFVEGTDANPTFGPGFHSKGPHYLRFGRAEVMPPRKDGDDFEVSSIRLAPEQIGTMGVERQLGSEQIFETLRRIMAEGDGETLIYLHGYANTMQSALERAAELKVRYQHDTKKPLTVFAFCWPTDGRMVPFLSYHSDRNDARMSGIAIARAMLRLRDWLAKLREQAAEQGERERCTKRPHLVAHSMGNYALRHAVQAVRSEMTGNLQRLFDQVFLMASDEDDDTLEKDYKLGILPDLCKAVHVYYATKDVPLDELADITKMLPDRLGTEGPRSKDGLHRKINLVDCTDVAFTKLTHGWHQYYRLRHEVYEDVRQVLAGAAPREIIGREFLPEERSYRIIPLGERVAVSAARPAARRGGGSLRHVPAGRAAS
ncbi:MAG: alpha/beta hydrolase [Kiloniellales bacterium]